MEQGGLRLKVRHLKSKSRLLRDDAAFETNQPLCNRHAQSLTAHFDFSVQLTLQADNVVCQLFNAFCHDLRSWTAGGVSYRAALSEMTG